MWVPHGSVSLSMVGSVSGYPKKEMQIIAGSTAVGIIMAGQLQPEVLLCPASYKLLPQPHVPSKSKAMAFLSKSSLPLLLFLLAASAVRGQRLSHKFYSRSCPGLQPLIRATVQQALRDDPTLGASILRLFFHDCFVNLGGPYWAVYLGRRDARTASRHAATLNLPPPGASFSNLVSSFAAKGLSARDMMALSGAHTIGQARCSSFRPHIYSDSNVDPSFATFHRQTCPPLGGNSLASLDVQTPTVFDNKYYQNLMARRGLLHSDQELLNGGSFVRLYSLNQTAFFNDFSSAMIRMGSVRPLTGSDGEIRLNCRKWN
ncbi:hypothetical protein GW17_00055813 [Ensete ventricosum]|nr:hypothetical protein GW17_00055813 [Ensete ventricosum]RZS25053.1 hypothetical protein BHM03_00058200 [Ensete ventricosum]